jgi:Lrp/AsnC family transcriptional regulator, regulator for asnA, asnC and gidA
MTRIAEIDLRIIRLLLADGSLTNAAIAEQLQTSEPTVRRRRTRLEQDGFIRLVGAVNPLKLGFNVVVIIGVHVLSSRIAAVEAELEKLPEIHFLGLTTGGYDLMLEAWLRSAEDIVRFTTQSLASIDGIVRTDVFQFLRLSKYYGWSGSMPGLEQAASL